MWIRDRWRTAALAPDSGLKPLERLVVLAYAEVAQEGPVVWLETPRLMAMTGLSRAAALRALSGAREAGWLELVEAARQHRAARYRMVVPGQPDTPERSASDTSDHAQRSPTQTAEPVQRSASETPADPSGLPDRPLNQSSGLSRDTSGLSRRPGTNQELQPAAAAARASSHHDPDPSVPIEILASKLRQHTPLAGLRTDKLRPDQAAEIETLIDLHGDQRLVDQALTVLRRDHPPQTIQAFLGAWLAMPPAGQHLAAVPDPTCTLPGHTGTTRHCVQCASETKAGDR